MKKNFKSILFICDAPKLGTYANTVIEHINSFKSFSQHNLYILSNIGNLPKHLDLTRFDVVVLHYSVSVIGNYYLSVDAKKMIGNFGGKKIVFIQDEYRKINEVKKNLADMKIDVLFTCFPISEAERIYNDAANNYQVKLFQCLTGYITEALIKRSKTAPHVYDRPLHLGYRGRQLPFWYGELGFEKSNIVDRWFASVCDPDLKVDLSYDENKRIYGEAWTKFIMSCKATLGVESGASIMDFTGELESQVEAYQLANPERDFYYVQKEFLRPYEGLYKLNQMSPRIFEAIMLKSCLVLYEGEYSGILQPWIHYIPLKKDFSNVNEVVNLLKNDNYLQKMVERAYEDIGKNTLYHEKTFIAQFDEVVNRIVHNTAQSAALPYTADEFENICKDISIKKKLYSYIRYHYRSLPLVQRMRIKKFVFTMKRLLHSGIGSVDG